MNLKIESNGEEKIFVFQDRNKITLGSSPSCDVSLQEEGVGSLHLRLHDKSGEYFVEDMGTEGGTYINSKSLTPNKLEPFNSFFPIKVGQDVFVYLLDEVASVEGDNREGTAININPEQLESLETPQKKSQEQLKSESVYVPKSHGKIDPESLPREIKFQRRKIVLGKKSKAKNKQKIISNLFYGILFISAMGFVAKEQILSFLVSDQSRVSKVNLAPKVKREVKAKKPRNVFSDKKAIAVARLDKCLGENEVVLCDIVKNHRELRVSEGFVQILSNIYFVVDIKEANNWKRAKLEKSEKELSILRRVGLTRLGGGFDVVNFKENDYVAKDVDIFTEESKKAAMLTELATLDLWERIKAMKGVEKLFVILINSNGTNLTYLGHTIIPLKTGDEMYDFSVLQKDMFYYWRTGIPYNKDLLEKGNFNLKSL